MWNFSFSKLKNFSQTKETLDKVLKAKSIINLLKIKGKLLPGGFLTHWGRPKRKKKS